MNGMQTQSMEMMPTWAVQGRTKAKDKAFLILGTVFTGFILNFLMTSFSSGISSFLILRARWAALMAATAIFLLMRKYPVQSAPFMAAIFFFSALLSSTSGDSLMFCLAKLAPMSLSMLLSFYLVPAALDPAQYKRLIAQVCFLLCVVSSASIALGVASGKIFSLKRYESLYFGPNTEGAYMGFAFFSALWLWAENPKSKFRNYFQLLIPAALVACYATSSRSSFFGLILGVGVWALTLLARGQTKRRKQFIIAFLLLCGAFVAKRSFFIKGWEMMTRKAETSEQFFESRMWIWEESWEAFKEKPFLGHGYGVSAQVTDLIQISLGTTVSVRDGSGYLGFLESLGIIGCVAFGLLILQLVLGEIHLLRHRIMNEYVLTAHGMSAITAFLLVNHVGEPWLLGPGNPTFHLFWFFMAAAFHFNHLARKEDKRKHKEAVSQRMAALEADRLARQQRAIQAIAANRGYSV